MPNFIVLRLHPSEPIAPADLRKLLPGLSVSALDLSFTRRADGALRGRATGLADPHLTCTPSNNVAIVETPPAGHVEYPTSTSYYLRLEIDRNGVTVVARRFHCNGPVETRS